MALTPVFVPTVVIKHDSCRKKRTRSGPVFRMEKEEFGTFFLKCERCGCEIALWLGVGAGGD